MLSLQQPGVSILYVALLCALDRIYFRVVRSLEIPAPNSFIYLFNFHVQIDAMLWIHCDPINFWISNVEYAPQSISISYWLIFSWVASMKFSHFSIALVQNEMTCQHFNKSFKYYLICMQASNKNKMPRFHFEIGSKRCVIP